LRAAGATEVSNLSPQSPSLPVAEAALDLVLCPNFLPLVDPADAAAWFREIARVLAPGGLCVLRAPVMGAFEINAWIPAGLFAEIRVVEELAFGGVSFRVAGTEDMAIVGDLSPLMAPADFEIWIASVSAGGLPELSESLLVPLPGFPGSGPAPEPGDDGEGASQLAQRLAEAEAELRAAERARDEARLGAVARDDREAIAQTTVTSLRATVERQLRQLAEVEVTLARLRAERDEAVSRFDAADARIHTAEAALRRREWEIDALRREVQRLGRTPGPER
ncbi:MAG TPA: methyltransferase domain-containing protein, partial [Polyangia bacterium]